MCLFVHMSGTTGADARARRPNRYARRCAQCGKVLGPRDRVAGHVRAYSCERDAELQRHRVALECAQE